VSTELTPWAELVSATFAELKLSGASRSFRLSLVRVDLGGGIRLVKVDTSPTVVHRTARLSGDGCDDVLILLHAAGRCVVEQEGRRVEPDIGSVSLHVADRPYVLDYRDESLSTALVLQFPRSMLPDRALAGTQMLQHGVDIHTPTAQVYRAFVRTIVDVGRALSETRRGEMGRTAVDLAVSMLRDVYDEIGATASSGLLAPLKKTIAQRAADPGLTPALLAAMHSLSLRYVQQLFADEGVSPAAYIRHSRLVLACRLLTDPRTSSLTIGAIAVRVGFHNERTFTRAFVREYGTTPGAFRMSHTHGHAAAASNTFR